MTATESRIIEQFRRVIPKLTEMERERLLAFGQGMECKALQQEIEKLKKQAG